MNNNKNLLNSFSKRCESCEEKVEYINGSKLVCILNEKLMLDFYGKSKCKKAFYGVCLYNSVE